MNAIQSRVASLSEAVRRAGMLEQSHKKSLTIHLLGCEGVEFSSFDRLLLEYDSLIKSIEAAGIVSLNIGIIGPSMGEYESGSSCAVTNPSGLEIKIFTRGDYYHVYLQTVEGGRAASPDVLALFNPGLWGYESWIPTLVGFKSLHNCKIMVTSYTLEEAEDDTDTIETVCGAENIRWLWEAEPNPFASAQKLDRKCAIGGREYFDNYAWQCFAVVA